MRWLERLMLAVTPASAPVGANSKAAMSAESRERRAKHRWILIF
jgi:hypothetical protein